MPAGFGAGAGLELMFWAENWMPWVVVEIAFPPAAFSANGNSRTIRIMPPLPNHGLAVGELGAQGGQFVVAKLSQKRKRVITAE